MTREQAIEVEKILRDFYNDKSGEYTMPEIIIDDEDVSHLYDKLFSIEYLDGIPDFKISIPIIPRLDKKQAIDLILEIYNTYKNKQESPFAGKVMKD